MSQTMLLPQHKGITSEELVNSAKQAKASPLTDLYNTCVTLHNLSPHCATKTFVWGAGNPQTAKVVMIGEAPGWQEDKFGIPFIGDAGQYLSSVLYAAGINRTRDVLLINTVCVIPDRIKETTEIGKPRTIDMLEQRSRVLGVIRELLKRPGNPLQAVVCLGKYPWVQLNEFTRMSNAVKNETEMNMRDVAVNRVKGWHGGGIEDKGGNIPVPVLATYHPSFIMRTHTSNPDKLPSQIPELVDYFEAFKRLGDKIHGKR